MTWLYRQTERRLWTVGFYAPDGSWQAESDHDSAGKAADRVHWLNGGQSHAEWLASGASPRLHDTLDRIARLT